MDEDIASDPVWMDMMQAVMRIYAQHKGDRAAYEQAAGALADGKQMPPPVRETFVTMCLNVYDEMQK